MRPRPLSDILHRLSSLADHKASHVFRDEHFLRCAFFTGQTNFANLLEVLNFGTDGMLGPLDIGSLPADYENRRAAGWEGVDLGVRLALQLLQGDP